MKKLLLKILLLLLAVGISIEGLILLARGFEREYFDGKGYAWVTEHKLKPKVVILGTSTVYFGLSPSVIAERAGYRPGEVVNLSDMGGTPLRSYNVWRSLPPSTFDSISIVLHSLDPWALSQVYYQNDQYSILHWNVQQRAYMFYPDSQFKKDPRVDGVSGQAAVGVLTTALLHRLQSDTARHLPADYGASVLDRVPKNFQAHTRAEWFRPFELFPISDMYIERLRMLKVEVEKHGGEFVLVLPPKRDTWSADYRNDCGEIDSVVIAKLNASLGAVKIIGSFTMFTPEQQKGFLNDNVHLNRYGQEHFSIYVAEQLMQLDSIPRSLVRPLYLY